MNPASAGASAHHKACSCSLEPAMHRFRRRSPFGACTTVLLGLLLGACAGTAPLTGNIEAPRYAVGDRWQYRIVDNLRRGAVSQLDVEVQSVSASGTTVGFALTDADGRTTWTEQLDGAGKLASGPYPPSLSQRFNPAIALVDYPLAASKVWREVIPTVRRDLDNIPGEILVYGEVEGRLAVTVPAGSYDGALLYRVVQFDDEQFWRTRTVRRDQVVVSPQAKGVVREQREAQYAEMGGPDSGVVRTESTVRELVSFTPGR
jgi:hypothetical protein